MFIFDASRIISYDNYMRYIFFLKKEFDKEKHKLFTIYGVKSKKFIDTEIDKYFEFRIEYRDLRQRIIKEVLKKFRPYLPRECLIYEFGSLVKFTDRIESDTDLTICYDEPKSIIYECVEELINYSIVYVLEHSIDHIHGKFQHYPIIDEYDKLTEENNLLVLKFDKGVIEYKCGPETLSENIMNIKNVRDYKSLIGGYIEKYAFKCNIDCLYSIEILENSTKHDFVRDLASLEERNDIFTEYKYKYKKYTIKNTIEVSYLKKAFKNTIVSMYIMIAYLRKRIKWLKHYSMTIDDFFDSDELKAFFGNNFISSIRFDFIKMIFYWNKIELLLNKNKILLSSRCYKSFTKDELNIMLYQEYNEHDMLKDILTSINNLNTSVFNAWRIIDEKCI